MKVGMLALGTLLLTISSSLLYFGNLIVVENLDSLTNNKDIVIENDYYNLQYSVPLSDTYDAGGGSLNDFMEREGVLDDLIKINGELNSSTEFKYVQMSQPTVYYLGEYCGPDSTICGGEEYRNQNDGENDYITSLNTIEGSEFVYKQIAGEVKKGKLFSVKDFDFSYNDTIPVVLGNDYDEFINVGQILEVQYYLKPIKVKVIGILEEDANLYLPSFGMNLDGYMMFPDIQIDDTASELYFHNTIMMLEKNEGFIALERLEDFEETITVIKSISERFNFAYNVKSIESSYQYIKDTENEINQPAYHGKENNKPNIINNLDKKQSTILRVILGGSLVLIGIGLALWYRSIEKANKQRLIIVKTKEVLKLSLCVLLMYACSFFVMLKFMQQRYDSFTLEAIIYPQGIVRLTFVIVLIIMGILICRKLDKGVDGQNVTFND